MSSPMSKTVDSFGILMTSGLCGYLGATIGIGAHCLFGSNTKLMKPVFHIGWACGGIAGIYIYNRHATVGATQLGTVLALFCIFMSAAECESQYHILNKPSYIRVSSGTYGTA